MADYFVWHGSAQDDGDATWNSSTLAFLTVAAAFATAAAGDDVWAAHDHSHIYGADTILANNGTAANPIKVTCVNRTTGALATTAVEKTTGISYTLDWGEDNVIYDGVNFGSADNVNIDLDTVYVHRNATVELLTNTTDHIYIPYGDCDFRWENIWFKANNAGHDLVIKEGVHFLWSGGGIAESGLSINNLIDPEADQGGDITLRNLDLSKVLSSIIDIGTTVSSGIYRIKLVGCKLPSGVPILSTSSFNAPHEIIAYSCDNGNGYYFFEETYLEGQIVQATNCYRTSGFKYDGTNGNSAKMVSNANALDSKRPLRFKLAEIWSDANPTLTVETITAGVTLQNDEFWIEVEYPDSTTKALRKIDRTSRQHVGYSGGSAPGTPANLTASTEGWTEDLAGEVKQKVAVTISGGATGPHTVWACLAKPSTTVYVDQLVAQS